MENERASQARGGARGRELAALTPLVLASSSPRRAGILRAGGWAFEGEPADPGGTRRAGGGGGEAAEGVGRRLRRERPGAAPARRLLGLVLGADTTVVVGREVLEKPRDAERSEEHTSELQSRFGISYAVF